MGELLHLEKPPGDSFRRAARRSAYFNPIFPFLALASLPFIVAFSRPPTPEKLEPRDRTASDPKHLTARRASRVNREAAERTRSRRFCGACRTFAVRLIEGMLSAVRARVEEVATPPLTLPPPPLSSHPNPTLAAGMSGTIGYHAMTSFYG